MEQRSYEVITEQGKYFRRNRRHLRRSKETEEDFLATEDSGHVTEPGEKTPRSMEAEIHMDMDHATENSPVQAQPGVSERVEQPAVAHTPRTRVGRPVRRPAHLKDCE